MKQRLRRFFINGWLIIIALVVVIGLVPIGLIVYSLWYTHQCNLIYTQVTECIGNSDMVIYGEYDGQTVKIADENRNSIWDTVTDKMVAFTSANNKPAGHPVIIRFGNALEMEVYPTDGKDLFVKHITADKKVKYYFIKDACDFTYLVKMVSVEGWYVPNTQQ